ncbi:glycine cleavage system protein H [Candidatus Mycoplasma pogonae]
MTSETKQLIIIENNGVYTIHPSTRLQDDLGAVNYIKVEPITIGTKLQENDLILTIESSKAIMYLRSPFAGEVVEFNEELETNPKLLNSSNQFENWILKLTK